MNSLLIKVSGDLSRHKKFLEFVTEKANQNHIVIICGAGTKISQALDAAGYQVVFNSHGRVLETDMEKEIMKKIIDEEVAELTRALSGHNVTVIPPYFFAGPILCPINADNLVKAFYLGFNEIYVFTLKERVAQKRKIFKAFPNVEAIGI